MDVCLDRGLLWFIRVLRLFAFAKSLYGALISLDSERGNFKLFGLIYELYLKKFELLGGPVVEEESFSALMLSGLGCSAS